MRIAVTDTECGAAGAGWVARFVLAGHDVTVHAPTAAARQGVEAVLADAAQAWGALFQAPLPEPGRIRWATGMAEAVAGAGYVCMAGPGDLARRRRRIADVQAAAPDAVIAAGCGDATLATLRAGAARPAHVIGVDGADPAYLLPGVQVTGGGDAAARACALLADVGMAPLAIAAEGAAPAGARLARGLADAARAITAEGAATADQIDAALRLGPALVWAQGGLAGTREGQDAQARQRRDAALVAMLHALKATGTGAGAVMRDMENRLYARAPVAAPGYPLRLHRVQVGGAWLDYNGHMTEFRYLQVMGDATDAVLIHIGLDAAYRRGGHSAYTVETHIRHLAEVGAGARLAVASRLLGHDAKRIRLHHSIERDDGTVVATGEHMLLHVDTAQARATPMPAAILARLDALAARDTAPHPDHAGAAIRPVAPR